MTPFHVARAMLDTYPLVELIDPQRGRRVRIAHRGATVLSIEVTHLGTRFNMGDGYCNAAELEAHSGSRFAVMAPFANRISDARYRFDDVEQDMQPDVSGDERGIRHGLVREVDFEVATLEADDESARVTFTTQAIRPDLHPGYPHAIDLTVQYVLDAEGLTLDAVMRNVGDSDAPCFFGWHPYLRVGDTPVDSWELEVDAPTLISVDEGSIPLPGGKAYEPVTTEPAKDYRQRRAIGSIELDQGYADQVADADGRIRTHLRDPATGLGVAMWRERGVTLVFTSDTVKRDVRKAVAIEPMESLTNAFNRDDCADTVKLKPGAERRYTCGVELATR